MDFERILLEKLGDHKDRIRHVKGVYERALELGLIHGGDPFVLKQAALLHDLCKYDTIESQVEMIDDLELVKKYQDTKVVYHALAAAAYVKKVLGINDPKVIEAIQYHMWGKPDMNLETMIIVVSDYSEPNRHFKEAKIVYECALKNLKEAYLLSLQFTVEHLLKDNVTPHIEQLECIEYYKETK